MATSRELRERLSGAFLDAMLDSDGVTAHARPNCDCIPCMTRRLLDALDREDAERKRGEDNILDRVHRTSCGHEWTMRHTACPTCFAEMRMDLALFKADRVVRQVFGGKQLLSLAALQSVSAGEHVECDDGNEPPDGRQEGPFLTPAEGGRFQGPSSSEVVPVPDAVDRPAQPATTVSTGTLIDPTEGTWAMLLLKKFPDFDPKWDDEPKKSWFAAFDDLMKRGGLR